MAPSSECTTIMCVRNGSRYIRSALDSIAAQSRVPEQVIVVDDGSSDGTSALVRTDYPWVEVVETSPAGHAAALNTGIALARHGLLAFLDHDDEWTRTKQATQVAALVGRPDLDAVVGSVTNVIEVNGVVVAEEPMGPGRVLGALLIRREALTRVGPMPAGIAHHGIVDWWSRAELAGLAWAPVPDEALRRRVHGQNSTITSKKEADASLLARIRDHRHRQRAP